MASSVFAVLGRSRCPFIIQFIVSFACGRLQRGEDDKGGKGEGDEGCTDEDEDDEDGTGKGDEGCTGEDEHDVGGAGGGDGNEVDEVITEVETAQGADEEGASGVIYI